MENLIKEILKEDFNQRIDTDFVIIKEALNAPIPVDLIKTNFGYEGNFKIENNKYIITIEKTCDGECYLFKFTMNNSYNMVGDVRKAFSVIPTIKNVVEEFISKNNPNLFIFLKTDTVESRERIYNEFSDEISKKYDYKRSVKTIDNVVVYFLAHDLNEKDYLDTLYFITSKYGDGNGS